MKLKLNKLHLIGLAVFVIGIAAMIFGMVILFRCINIKDISKLKYDDIKSGVYVNGELSTVVKGYPINATNEGVEPLELYTTDSDEISEGAYKSYFLVELDNDKGKYVCVIIDEYLYTDLYHQLFSGNMEKYNLPYKVEGIITSRKADKKLIQEGVKKWKDKYSSLYYNALPASDVAEDNVADYCIELKPLGSRKMWWLYSIPLLFAGISVFILGGRPYERIK